MHILYESSTAFVYIGGDMKSLHGVAQVILRGPAKVSAIATFCRMHVDPSILIEAETS